MGQGKKRGILSDELDRKFWQYHHDNPHIYALIVKYAREVKAAGFTTYSINAIFERIRWHVLVETKSEDSFKMSNDHRSRYARLVMKKEPDLKGFFNLRPLTTYSTLDDDDVLMLDTSSGAVTVDLPPEKPGVTTTVMDKVEDIIVPPPEPDNGDGSSFIHDRPIPPKKKKKFTVKKRPEGLVY